MLKATVSKAGANLKVFIQVRSVCENNGLLLSGQPEAAQKKGQIV